MIRRMWSSAPTPTRRAGVPAALLSLAAATLLTACGGEADTAAPPAGGGGGMTVSIAEPASGATVSTPMTVKVDSSVELGPTESGKHHVHVYFDDNVDDYLVVESNTAEITNKPAVTPGQHVMHVSLRNADHSAAGAETQIPVTVGAGSGGGAPTPTEEDGGGQYGY